jgi:hypothetical protein
MTGDARLSRYIRSSAIWTIRSTFRPQNQGDWAAAHHWIILVFEYAAAERSFLHLGSLLLQARLGSACSVGCKGHEG